MGIAERIQREVNRDAVKQERNQAAELACRDTEIERLKKELEREQEWKPYEDTHSITRAQYTGLAESVPSGAAHYMTDAEALDWICREFGFDRSQVTILHQVNFSHLVETASISVLFLVSSCGPRLLTCQEETQRSTNRIDG